MNCSYTVRKKKANRIAYRIMGLVFCTTAALQLISFFKGHMGHAMLTILITGALGGYGIYLIKMSLRKLAFDIKYYFNEKGVDVEHHYGKTHYDFSDIEFVTMVIADENMIFYVLNLKAKKDIYTIPFTMQGELCESIYEFVHNKIDKKDDNE